MTKSIPPHLLSMLICPISHGVLHYDKEKQLLISPSAKLAFPVKDGIPILTKDAAQIYVKDANVKGGGQAD